MEFSFFKYQGTGNDFVLADNREGRYSGLSKEQIAQACDRHFGIGADGLILLSASEQADFRMDYFNSDGEASTMCGNGGRCLVALAKRLGMGPGPYTFEAIDGIHQGQIEGEGVHLSMIDPRGFQVISEEEYWIDTGSPHYVRFLPDEASLTDLDVQLEGSHIRHAEPFGESGTNVNFVVAKAADHLLVRTYERGVEAETLSCGTGVVACASVQAIKLGIDRGPLTISTPGGELSVRFERNGENITRVTLTGPATYVFAGTISV